MRKFLTALVAALVLLGSTAPVPAQAIWSWEGK